MNGLDTQTKEILQKEHDSKRSPPKAAEFALVLIRKGVFHQRIVRAVSKINHCSEAGATGLVNRSTPVTINPDLAEEEERWFLAHPWAILFWPVGPKKCPNSRGGPKARQPARLIPSGKTLRPGRS